MTKKIKNGLSYDKNGWKYISIKGEPKERGYAYGYLCANDFKEIQKICKKKNSDKNIYQTENKC